MTIRNSSFYTQASYKWAIGTLSWPSVHLYCGRGLSRKDMSAQLPRNRQGWLWVPHIANLGVFNQGVGAVWSQPRILWVLRWLDSWDQLRSRKPAVLRLAVWPLCFKDLTKNVGCTEVQTVVVITRATLSWTPQPAERLTGPRQKGTVGIISTVTA